MQFSEHELCAKLLTKLHLSVPERQALPAGRARFSVVREVVAETLRETGWFPYPLNPARGIGDGALIEARGEDFYVHEQHEVGVGRYSAIRATRAPNLERAIRAYIEASRGSPIDGVPIDWEA